MNELGQAASAYPLAFAMPAAGQQNPFVLAAPAHETGLRDEPRRVTAVLFGGGLRIEQRCLADFDTECARWADAEAEARSVAQFLAQHSGLTVHQYDGPLHARCKAVAAAVAQGLVNAHDLSQCQRITSGQANWISWRAVSSTAHERSFQAYRDWLVSCVTWVKFGLSTAMQIFGLLHRTSAQRRLPSPPDWRLRRIGRRGDWTDSGQSPSPVRRSAPARRSQRAFPFGRTGSGW